MSYEDHDPGDEQRRPKALSLSFCPFCKTITYYPQDVVERAEVDGLVRTNCAFCKLKFWPGPVPTKQVQA